MSLKIQKLKDMTPIKMSLTVTPDLMSDLKAYARIYERTYQDTQEPAALIPHMLEAFLATDSGFKKAKKELATS